MYILVKKSLTSHKCVGIAHGVLMCHLKFHTPNNGVSYLQMKQCNRDYENWLSNSFKKVICDVTDEEFESAKTIENNVVVTESSLDNKEIALVFCPRPNEEWPIQFKYFKMINF